MGFFDFLKSKPTIPVEALMPWVHRRVHFELLQELREADEPLEIVPLNDAFALCVGVGTSEGPIPLRKSDRERLGLTPESATAKCLENMMGMLSKPTAGQGLVFFQTSNQGAGAALIAVPMLAAQLPIKGAPVAMMPTADLVIVTGVDDDAALLRMLELAEAEHEASPEYRSLRVVCFTSAGKSETWLPPKTHPLYARFLAAESASRHLDANELFQSCPETAPAPLAPLTAMPASKGGTLKAAWIRGANVLVPSDCDTIVLLDTDDAVHRRVEVDFEIFRTIVPCVLEPVTLSALAGTEEGTNETPVFWRTRGDLFLSAREQEFFHLLKPDTFELRDAPLKDLLNLWDEGHPVLVSSDESCETIGALCLNAADGRTATTNLADMHTRIDRLPAQDRVGVRSLMMAQTIVSAVARGIDPATASQDIKRKYLEESSSNGGDTLADEMMSGRLKVTSASAVNAGGARNFDPAKVFPVVRPPQYERGHQANQQGMVAHLGKGQAVTLVEPPRFTRDLFHGLTVELVSDAGDVMFPLTREGLPQDFQDAVWRSAMLNLEANSLSPLKPTPTTGVFRFPVGDDYDAARALLLPQLAAECEVKGEPLIFAPTLHRVWVTGSKDESGIAAVLDAIDSELEQGTATTPYQYRQILFGWPFVVRDGKVKRWAVPSEHPQAARIAALDKALEKRRSDSTKNIGAFAQAVTTSVPLHERAE